MHHSLSRCCWPVHFPQAAARKKWWVRDPLLEGQGDCHHPCDKTSFGCNLDLTGPKLSVYTTFLTVQLQVATETAASGSFKTENHVEFFCSK